MRLTETLTDRDSVYKYGFEVHVWQKAVNTLCICVLFDMLGGFLLQPVFAKMCSNAEGYNGPKIDNAFGDPGHRASPPGCSCSLHDGCYAVLI